MAASSPYPRLAEARLAEALTDTPVVLVHGPRQCGKTTLARMVGDRAGHAYFTFDDAATLSAAQTDPTGFVDDLPERAILDEVQRVPHLFASLKRAVDRDRRPGRFLLTGSSNVLLLPRLSDSLAGRMEIVRLHPLAQAELHGGKSNFIERLFDDGFSIRLRPRLGRDLASLVASGGYPAALARPAARRRAAWYRDYVETLIQRDVRELARIASLDTIPRLLALVGAQTARLLNISELSAPLSLSRPTVRDYVTLLERIFLVEELPPWHGNRLSRLVKTPKVHLGDSGLACALLGLDAEALNADRTALGQLLETFVVQELRRLASGVADRLDLLHYRDRDGAEVDVVLERGPRELAGVEVKAGATVTASDFRGLRKLQEAAGARFKAGVVLYDGEAILPFGERLHAVPLRCLWES
jgi:predicted AAA+ superfamily ATPase